MPNQIGASGAGMSGASAVHFYVFPPQPIMLVRLGGSLSGRCLPWLPRGEMLMAFGVTEPTSGVDTSRINTKAERKRATAGSSMARKCGRQTRRTRRRFCCWRAPRPATKSGPLDGMTLFFADLDRKHCDVRVIDKLGRAAVDSNEVFIDGLEVADENVVGDGTWLSLSAGRLESGADRRGDGRRSVSGARP